MSKTKPDLTAPQRTLLTWAAERRDHHVSFYGMPPRTQEILLAKGYVVEDWAVPCNQRIALKEKRETHIANARSFLARYEADDPTHPERATLWLQARAELEHAYHCDRTRRTRSYVLTEAGFQAVQATA